MIDIHNLSYFDLNNIKLVQIRRKNRTTRLLNLKRQANSEVIAIGLCPLLSFPCRMSHSAPLHVYLSSWTTLWFSEFVVLLFARL